MLFYSNLSNVCLSQCLIWICKVSLSALFARGSHAMCFLPCTHPQELEAVYIETLWYYYSALACRETNHIHPYTILYYPSCTCETHWNTSAWIWCVVFPYWPSQLGRAPHEPIEASIVGFMWLLETGSHVVLQVIRRFLAAFCHESILFGRCFTARKEILSKENYDKLSAHLDKKKSSFRKLEPDEVRPDKKYGMENMSRVRASLCSHVFAHFQAVCAISFKQV